MLGLEGNPLKGLEGQAGSIRQLMDFLKERQQDKIPWSEVKLVVVGDGGEYYYSSIFIFLIRCWEDFLITMPKKSK
jgi:hypothetical protein